jgi:hypothetical protein
LCNETPRGWATARFELRRTRRYGVNSITAFGSEGGFKVISPEEILNDRLEQVSALVIGLAPSPAAHGEIIATKWFVWPLGTPLSGSRYRTGIQ